MRTTNITTTRQTRPGLHAGKQCVHVPIRQVQEVVLLNYYLVERVILQPYDEQTET